MLHQGSAQLNKLLGFRFLGLSLPAGGFIIIVRFTRCEGQLTIGRDIDSWNRQQNDSVFHTSSLVVNYIIQGLLKAHFHMKCKLFLRIGFFSAGSTPQDCCYLQLSPSSFEDGLKYRRVKLLVFDCLTKVRCCYDQKQKQRKRKLVRVSWQLYIPWCMATNVCMYILLSLGSCSWLLLQAVRSFDLQKNCDWMILCFYCPINVWRRMFLAALYPSMYGDECLYVHSFVAWQLLLGVIAGSWVLRLAKELWLDAFVFLLSNKRPKRVPPPPLSILHTPLIKSWTEQWWAGSA